MTTCIRFTMFPPVGPPITGVMPEDSLKDSVGDTQMPSEGPMFIVRDVFEVDSDDIKAQTIVGGRRAKERYQREANMAIMYHYIAEHRFGMVGPGSVIVQTVRSPLTVDELRYVHEQLALHPEYNGQRFLSLAEDGTTVHYPETGV